MKRSFVSAQRLREIAAQYPTPFHFYDERGIRDNASRLHQAFAWNPGFREYFAVKANPNPVILNILKAEGCGVDCATSTELLLAEALGFRGEEIMFSSNMTPFKDFLLAHRLGAIINLDDVTDVEYIAKLPSIPKKMCLRYNPGKLRGEQRHHGYPGRSQVRYDQAPAFPGCTSPLGAGRGGIRADAFLVSNAVTNDYYPALARTLFEVAGTPRRNRRPLHVCQPLRGIGSALPPEPRTG